MKRVTVLLSICVMFVVTSIQAQVRQGPPEPGPDVKKLAYRIGTWNLKHDARPFGSMPGGKFAATEKCEWYSGGFFVTCHWETTGAIRPSKGVSFLGYDQNEKVYTYHGFESTGDVIDAKGTVDGDTWTWTSESKMGDGKMTGRVTIKLVSKTEYSFKLELSRNGKEFSLLQESTARKMTSAPGKKS
jgi:hypothetical protein